MYIRIASTIVWLGIASIGVHMMLSPAPYEQWADSAQTVDGFFKVFADFANASLDTLGGFPAGRVLTILGVCMIAGTWIPMLKRKHQDDTTPPHQARGEELILIGESQEEPHYEYKI